MTSARPLVALLVALVAWAPPAAAQGGWSKAEYPELGVAYPEPKNHEVIPVQPTEEFLVKQYKEKPARREKDRKRILPTIDLVLIPWSPDPEPEPEEPVAEEEADGERSKSKPAKGSEDKKPPPPITTLQRYVDQRIRSWELASPEPGKEKDGYATAEYELIAKKDSRGRVGWVYEWRNAERTYAFICFSGDDDFKKQVKIWRKMASQMRLTEPESAVDAKMARWYAKRPEYKNPEFRLKIRSKLVKGWKADDTENFILIFSTKDQALIRTMKRELEAIRLAYLELFPPVEPITAVSAVRICKDAQEYRDYGGPPGSGGYWYDKAEELVFFDYADREGGRRGSGKADSRIVLYHEAFHQYIYYSAGAVAPHSWFNEGHGDFFSGARFDSGGKVSKIGVNPWRIGLIQRSIQSGNTVPFEDIIGFSQAEFYNPKIRGVCYAQAWSMIYFLRLSKEAQRREDWANILPIYFQELKRVFDIEYAQLEKSGLTDDEKQLNEAKKRSRDAAVKLAFQGIDLVELEESWKAFTMGLKAPKR
jgi:hypothetical protein